jgi:hypothetical protein
MKNNLRMLSLALCMLPTYLHAETGQNLTQDYRPSEDQNTRSAESIPAGTIIPVSLNSTLRSDKSGSGDAITATVMQDVPLAMGKTLRAGSRVTGHVVAAITAGKGSDATGISFQFDQVRTSNLTIPVTTNLRALASRSAVLAAATLPSSLDYPEEQIQIGGDQISYGNGGPVMVGSQVVGKYTSQGVLAYGGQDPGPPCRGTIDDNNHPQAFWFFSVNACGAYGFGDLTVFHTGRNAPVGEVTLSSKSKVLKVDKGSAMLLLVDGGGAVETQAARTASSRASSRPPGQ